MSFECTILVLLVNCLLLLSAGELRLALPLDERLDQVFGDARGRGVQGVRPLGQVTRTPGVVATT